MSDIQSRLAQIRDDRIVAEEAQVKNAFCHGFVEVGSSGDSTAQISFPVLFVEEPNFMPGLILQPNQGLAPGGFPLWSAFVLEWITKDQGDHHRVWWVGAVLGISISSSQELRTKLSYTFTARAFRNPTAADLTAGTVL